MPAEARRHEVAVVGAGQAGLAIGYFLRQQERDFVILERAEHVAQQWRGRWDSLKLFTSRRYDSLPGRAFPGAPDGYPSRDEVATYLDAYAQTFDLPVRLETDVRALRRDGDGFVLQTSSGDVLAGQVVVATGPFQEPRVPAFASSLSDDVVQFHSTRYRNPADLPSGRTLVVGGGNTGYQIAEELAGAGREVHLAIGGTQKPMPTHLLGLDTFSILDRLGAMRKTADSWIGRRQGITMRPRATGASGRTVTFSDGSDLQVEGVVWATGFTSDYSWIDAPITDKGGRVSHRRGQTDIPGLYMLGMPWQYTRGSALLGWVKDDAQFVAQRIAEYAASAPRPSTTNGTTAAATQVVTTRQGD